MNRYTFHKYLVGYFFELPAYIFHEYCHWVIAVIGWILSINTFPTVHVDRYFKVEVSNKGTMTDSWSMYVLYNTYGCNTFFSFLVSIAPAIGTILLFIISSWYLDIMYLTQISSLWLSMGDIKKILRYYRKFRGIIRIKLFKVNIFQSLR